MRFFSFIKTGDVLQGYEELTAQDQFVVKYMISK
jgi:hypothetical protein